MTQQRDEPTCSPGPEQTLLEGKRFLRQHFEAGTQCPCCGQLVKLYRRSLTSAMAVGLVTVYRYNRHYPGQFVHLEEHMKAIRGLPPSIRGDFAKLRYWDMIEGAQGERNDGSRRLGLWRITGRGIAFVERQSREPKYIFIYNNKVLKFSEESIGIEDAFGNKFSYDEIMCDPRLLPGEQFIHRDEPEEDALFAGNVAPASNGNAPPIGEGIRA